MKILSVLCLSSTSVIKDLEALSLILLSEAGKITVSLWLPVQIL